MSSGDSNCCGGSCGSGCGEETNYEVKIGQHAPAFRNAMAYQKGKPEDGFFKLSLADYHGKWVVFFFYPRDFTFVCPTELKGFAKAESEFKALNCEVVACSTDSKWSHKNWLERDLLDVTYPVVADATLEIAKAYGVLGEDGEADRGLYIIDPEGVIRYIVVSSGSVGRSVKETLRVLKAVQTGEKCPMDWEVGDKTLGKA